MSSGEQPRAELVRYDVTSRQFVHLLNGDFRPRRELLSRWPVGLLCSLTFREGSDTGHGSLRTVNLDTMTISDLPSSEGLVTSFRSPDGPYLVSTNVAGDRLLLFDFSTQKWSQLTEANVGYFQWSSDSKSICFDNGYSNDPAISRVHLSDQRVEKVLSLEEFRRVVTPWNTWFGLTPQGDILLLHDTGSQEVHALDLDIP